MSETPPPLPTLNYQPPIPGPNAGKYAPCPRCNCPSASPVSFTWWGGVIGPKVLTHVKCYCCKHAYNGKTGRDNTTGIVVYTLVGLGIGLAIVVVTIFSK